MFPISKETTLARKDVRMPSEPHSSWQPRISQEFALTEDLAQGYTVSVHDAQLDGTNKNIVELLLKAPSKTF